MVKLGDELLRYLNATSSKGLHYMKTSAQRPYGCNDELATQASINNLEVFVDASHALERENYKSVTGVILCVGGSPIAWASGRQPFVTTSTAETELVSCGEGFQCGESLAALLEVMGVGRSTRPSTATPKVHFTCAPMTPEAGGQDTFE